MKASLLLWAVGPSVVLMHVVYLLDRRAREPVRNMVRYFGAGALAALIAILVGLPLWGRYPDLGDPAIGWLLRLVLVFVGVALVEEGAKLLMLAGAARGDRHLDEPFDWIVYGVSVALGFATVENLGWLWSGAHVGWERALTAVPGHALNGTMMGYHLGRAMRDEPAGRPRRRRLALVEPVIWHGIYDFLLFQMGPMGSGSLVLLLAGLFLLQLTMQWRIAADYVREMWDPALPPLPPILHPQQMFDRLFTALVNRGGGWPRPRGGAGG